ncbi:MAG: toll/interleukin-1 receptor domain-containing protein [Saprospiraceae bacterium]|nr:toll/interleukin-1 receptor domain-containing protein [Candidatus Defluviibacterium haderslevense]MBK7244688.1 toll/interleukin-1 receptor domain-containing protein [Candidatus Defluviibacterium haderslevense]
MSRCTAPVKGHHSAEAQANCPACRYKSRSYTSYSSYNNYESNTSPRVSTSNSSRGNYNVSKGRTIKPRWSSPSSVIYYTPAEVRTLTPVRENVEKREIKEDFRDVFLCHAWDDRKDAAKELHNSLEAKGVSVWFSEKDVLLGSSLLREIDKGLAKSKVGIVLVTPNFLDRIRNEGIANKELSALLARDLLVPIVHETTFEALRDESPLLGSRSGLSTSEDTIENIASKLAELVST